MSFSRSSAIGFYVRFLAVVVGISLAVVGLGYWPTQRLGGAGAVSGMLAGCAISLIGSLIGVVPVAANRHRPASEMAPAILMSTAVRFPVVLVLGLAAALSGLFDRPPLLVWVAISYLVLLTADTVFVVRIGGSDRTKRKR